MWSHLLALVCALLLLPVQAMAGAKEEVAALAPSGLTLGYAAMWCVETEPLRVFAERWLCR